MEIVSIQNNIGLPKYKQIIASIEDALLEGLLKKGDKLPSLNAIKMQHKVSRDTVLMAFNELKNRGIIESIAGKGFYVTTRDIRLKQKFFLLFDELNAFKEDLYNAFLEKLPEDVQVDIFFHHFNPHIFNKLIVDNKGKYNAYIIMPANLSHTRASIENLPKDKVYVLDQINDELTDYPAIYQNFETDLYYGLKQIIERLKKYQKTLLVFNAEKQPIGLLNGFKKFCKDHQLPFDTLEKIDEKPIEKGTLFLVLEDKSLIRLIKQSQAQQLYLAKDFGILAYNDTMLKEIVEGGITTITTDFKWMGQRLAKMILNKDRIQIKNPNRLILRKSL